MSDYVARPKPAKPRAAFDAWDEYYDDRSSITVHEDDAPTSVDTGLVDRHGNALHRALRRNPIGFKVRS